MLYPPVSAASPPTSTTPPAAGSTAEPAGAPPSPAVVAPGGVLGFPATSAPSAVANAGTRPRRGRGLLLTAVLAAASGAIAASVVTGPSASGPVTLSQTASGARVAGPSGTAPAGQGTTQSAAAALLPSVVQVRTTRGAGSGVVIDAEGHVLTNHHVVRGSDEVSLQDSTGAMVRADVIGSDADSDIAVLRVRGGAPPAAALGTSADLAIGQPVIAVGSPLGLNGTVTSGVISALERRSSSEAMIQTDAPINPGNSGGPLVDLAGRVIGINTSIATVRGAGGNIGIGFAVPIDRAVAVAQQLIDG
ncbi:trypsin-like peptidase domain-containing protein [Quadrisphaera sp. KR29]|uniref:trypsin-like peptidase domain-containing protein n=1 Tax=Quadrisphaera sp. KR29 TaxID=3461391 RepID=UPI004044CDF5